jgi:hypothetical protein
MIDLLTHQFRFRVTIPNWVEIADVQAAIERVREVAEPGPIEVLTEGYFDFVVNGEDLDARDNVQAAFQLGALIWDLNQELQSIETGIEIEPVS